MKMLNWRYAVLCLLIGLFCTLSAQTLEETLPLDPQVRTGVLPNGLTYYIRKNVKPEKRVELRLAVNTGSVQEDEDQLGLAHFVEHMCFRGTARFPGIEVIHYLQSVGSDFGPDINAYTSFDRTVYKLTLPSDKEEILSKGLMIMEDWASAVSFKDEDIDSERKVVVEEWRIGRGADQRMRDKYLPILLKDSKYANRLPIGTKESIETSTHQALRRFYTDWYRPDNMAFIVVGDVDPDAIEKQIREGFGTILPTKQRRSVESYDVPDNKAPLCAIASDKENTHNVGILLWKSPAHRAHTVGDARRELLTNLVHAMINERLAEIQRQANPPFIQAGTGHGSFFTRAKDAFQAQVVVQDGGFDRGLRTLLTELERVRRHGFTAAEFDRARLSLLKTLERMYKERDKTQSASLVNEYVELFLSGEASPGIEYDYALAQKLAPGLSLTEASALAASWMTDDNQVSLLLSVEKEGQPLPGTEQVNTLRREVAAAAITPYAEKELPKTLLSKEPVPGTVTATREVAELGVTELTLSNGVQVVLRPTDFQNDQILFTAYRFGGSSLYADDYELSAQFTNGYPSEAGIGAFSATDLKKFLAGKKASAQAQLGSYSERLSGGSTIPDLPVMFELIHAQFTESRRDEAAFSSMVSRQKAMLKNILSNPMVYFRNEATKVLYQNHPRSRLLPTDADWETLTLDKVLQLHQERFASARGFTFIIVGSFTVEGIRPLVEKYLASLPGQGESPGFRDLKVQAITGPYEQKILRGHDPKSLVLVSLEKPAAWSRDEAHLVYSLGSILQRIYIDKLREEMNGVYGLSAGAGIRRIPTGTFNFQLSIPCAPQNADKLVAAAIGEIRRIQTEGLKPEELQKEIESQRRAAEKNAKENGAWLGGLAAIHENGETNGRLANPEELIALLKPEELQRVAKAYFDTDKLVRFTLYPEEAPAAPAAPEAQVAPATPVAPKAN
jgi:zinc protease